MKKILITLSLFVGFYACQKDNMNNPNVVGNSQPATSGTTTTTTTTTISRPTSYDGISIPASLLSYYQSVDFSKNGVEFKDDLATLTITKHTNILDYGQRRPYLEKADQDPANSNNVIAMYFGDSRSKSEISRGTVNTEHIYPQSFLKKTSNAPAKVGDLHHLRYCDAKQNSDRGNLPFAEGSGRAGKVKNGRAWYPGDEWKGDVARMIMYLYLRYDLPFERVISDNSGVGLLLKWNAQDPTSDFEKQRNNEIEQAQGNRNPFIDNPYLATKIFGEAKGYTTVNTWK